MGSFVDTPMSSEFNKQGSVPKGSPGTYDGDDCPIFDGWHRTKSPLGEPEKTFEKAMPTPSGENDQF
jgi:hypothetical protein